MVLAPIDPARETQLRRLLDSMNEGPGRVDPNNDLISFRNFDTIHFARLLILDDQTTQDVGVYGLEPRTYPLYFAFLGNVDGDEQDFLSELATRAPDGLRALFSCCEGFGPESDLLDWMRRHRNPSIASYVNTRGRTVSQIREDAALRDALEAHIAGNSASMQGRAPREIHATLRRFVEAEVEAGRLRLSEATRTPVSWQVRNTSHLIGMPLVLLLMSPFLLVALPIYVVLLRRQEKTDPEVIPTVDQDYTDRLSLAEDHDVTNQFSAFGSLKPGRLRLWTVRIALTVIDYAARHVVWPGRLGRIRTIHFARWTFVRGRERILFCSNYDGGVDSYMDDFINKAGFGLNALFSSGIGYPTTNWLIRDGCADERKYKEFLRRHTIPTQVWYKAYPGLTAIDLDRNSRLRQGLASADISNEAASDWVALL